MIAFENSHLQVLYTEHQSDFLLITFAAAQMRANRRRFYAAGVTELDKIATLGFVATRPNWYPAADMSLAIAAVQPILDRFTQKVTLGYSMGGYAAIKYAKSLASSVSISLCPNYSVDPSDIPDEFQGLLRRTLNGLNVNTDDLDEDMRITSDCASGRIYVFYDNKAAPEVVPVAQIENCMPITKFSMPYTRHHTERCFNDAASLSQLVTLCRSGDEKSIRSFSLAQRRSAPVRVQTLIAALADRHFRWAVQVRDRYPAALYSREGVALANRLANAAFQRGDIDWAITALEKVSRSRHSNSQTFNFLVDAYMQKGDVLSATGALRRLIALVPEEMAPRERLVSTLLLLPDLNAARLECDLALALFPKQAALLHLASDIASRSGKLEQAITYAEAAAKHAPSVLSYIEHLGVLVLQAGRLDEAEHHFNAILARDTQHAGALSGMAAIRKRRGAAAGPERKRSSFLKKRTKKLLGIEVGV
jgi:Flp pilus assembly protein TadD